VLLARQDITYFTRVIPDSCPDVSLYRHLIQSFLI